MEDNKRHSPLDHWVLWPTVIVFVAFCLFVALDREGADQFIKVSFAFITGKLGWIYQVGAFGYFVILLWFAFSKYGSKKLGDGKPEFSTFTWWGMIFTVSSSASVLVWSSLESFYYVKYPPFTFAPFSTEAYEWAHAYSLFHWGPVPFAIYSLLGIMFGYVMHVKKEDVSRPSGIFRLIYGRSFENSWKGKTIDVFILFSLVCSYGTSLGICTPLISKLLEHIFGITPSVRLDTIILLAVTGLIAICLYAGLYRGISLLSNIRVIVGYSLLVILFCIGPTSFMINNFVDSLGILMQNFIRMTFYTDQHSANTFPQDWTIFYFAWFIAAAVFCGMYLGRISAGRSVRQVLLGSLAANALGNWVYFIVLQNYAIVIQREQTLPFDQILETGGTAGVTVATWTLFPMAGFFMLAFLFLAYIATTTFINGSVYTCAMMTTKNLAPDAQPGRPLRIFWSFLIGAIAIALLYIGGLKPVQTISIIGTLPTVIIIYAMIWVFIKAIKKDQW
jgi:L-carnitine/gamma-butyrobetaine antiporter